MKRISGYIVFFALIMINALNAQDDIYLNMSLEEMFNLDVVVSASKKPEDIFEAPLSIDIIKKDDIINAGITSIPEALRLAPGLIVREQTPGNYDVHIRGYDNVMTNVMTPLPTNSIILVMINNRHIYNHFSGGTFWESLPVDIMDIERIEIIRGPASALYGPNAAAGVIHIITNQEELEGVNSNALLATNGLNYRKANANVGYVFNDKTSISFSTHYNRIKRQDRKFYDWNSEKYIEYDSLKTLIYIDGVHQNISELEGYETIDKEISLENMAFATTFRHKLSDDYLLNFDFGSENSSSIKSFYNNFSTPLSEYHSKSSFFNFNGQFDHFFTQLSFNTGEHKNNAFWNEYKFDIFDASIEYDYEMKNFNIRPGLSYKETSYEGEIFSPYNQKDFLEDKTNKTDYNNKMIISKAFSILSNYYISKELRLIGGYRLDDYNLNDELSHTYEAALTYRLNKNNLFRFVHSRANRAPFMIDTYIDQAVMTELNTDEGFSIPVIMHFNGNKNLHHLTNRLFEFGWRFKYSTKLSFDTELFTSQLDNFIDLDIVDDSIEIYENIGIAYAPIKYIETEDIEVEQVGISFSLNYEINEKYSLKAFATFQKTNTEFNNDSLTKDEIKLEERENAGMIDEDATPSFYGGLSFDFSPVNKLFFNINCYYVSKHNYHGLNIDLNSTEDKKLEIDAYTILNLTANYKIHDQLSIFVAGKNLLDKHYEYGYTDKIEPSFWFGIKANFHN